MEYLIFVIILAVLNESNTLSPDILKYDRYMKDFEATGRRKKQEAEDEKLDGLVVKRESENRNTQFQPLISKPEIPNSQLDRTRSRIDRLYSNDSSEYHYSNDSILEVMNYSPKEKHRRLLEELMTAMVGKDEKKGNILTDPEHPYINATTGQCFNHVITSFSKACITSTAFGGWRTIKGSCKALGMK